MNLAAGRCGAFRAFIPLAALLSLTAPAAAYVCKLSPDGTAVIVKTSNPGPQPVQCTVTCRFKVPDGVDAITCTQTIPAGAAEWYLCLRPAAGKNYDALDGGEENRVKP
jgi:hypothetical protein